MNVLTKTKSTITIAVLSLMALISAYSFSTKKENDEQLKGTTLTIASLNGPSSIPLAYLYENSPDLGGADIAFQLHASPVAELPKLLQGEADIGFLPPNLAAKVYNSSNKAIIVLGISGNGNLYLLSDDAKLSSLSDLAGKTVYAAGQGATPEYIFRYLTDGIDLSVDYSIQTAQLAAALASAKIHYALIPEPFASVATAKSPSVYRSLDIQQLYEDKMGKGSSYPMTLMVCRAEFASAHPVLIQKFLKAYKEACEWTIAHPTEAGSLVEKHTLGLKAEVAAASIPNGNYVWIPAKEGKGNIEQLLKLFLSFAPESIGASLPDNAFYY